MVSVGNMVIMVNMVSAVVPLLICIYIYSKYSYCINDINGINDNTTPARAIALQH